MALTIMAIGAAGVISMQRTSIQGNIDARQRDIASAIARQWVERIRLDAMTWTLPSESNPTAVCPPSNGCLSTTTYLKFATANPKVWIFPTMPSNQPAASTQPLGSPAFDIFGRDLSNTEVTAVSPAVPPTVYCVNLMFQMLDSNPQSNLVRADVRVFWLRNLGSIPAGATTPYTAVTGTWCSAASTTNADPTGANNTTLYHYLYAETTVRPNPGP
jgi:type II secretory pathway pseudopilin PulG